MTARKRSSMQGLSKKTAEETDRQLRDEELEVFSKSAIDWESLKPMVTDSETYEKLIAAVKKSTAKNENLAQLRKRLESLGKGGVELVRRVIQIAKK